MNGSVCDGRFAAEVFNDVNLSARRPLDGGNVVAEQPERRPDTFSLWHADTRLEAPIGLGELALRLESRRSVVSRDTVVTIVNLADRLNDQRSVLLASIASAGCVVLQFLVAPAIPTGFCIPFLGIDRRAVRSAEFVAPGQNPFR